MSVLGVETIVAIAVPLLTIFYPMTLNLIIISFFDKYLNKGFYVGSLSFTLLWGIIEALETIKKPVTKILGERLGAMFVEISAVSNEFLKKFPLASTGFGWLIPAILLGIIGLFIYKSKKTESFETV